MIHKDAQETQRLEEEVKEQRGLINSLTAETTALREDVAALQVREADYSWGCPICEHTDPQRSHAANKCFFFSVSS